MSARRIVVPGAAGFVGAATVRRLLGSGHAVLAWVRAFGRPITEMEQDAKPIGMEGT